MKNGVILGTVVLVVLAAAALFYIQNMNVAQAPSVVNNQTPNTSPSAMTNNEQTASEAGQAAVKDIMVTSTGLKFNPVSITVKEGDRVKITYKNNQGNHDFVIDEFNAKTRVLKANEQQTIEFVADKKGTFEYYCSVPGHRQQGMVGKLIVE